jgi:hypothetical protein
MRILLNEIDEVLNVPSEWIRWAMLRP